MVATTRAIEITGAGLAGVLRMTWVHDGLAHVLEHAGADETTGTWTGLAGLDHQLPPGTDVDIVALKRLCARGQIADLIWEAPDDLAAEHGRAFDAAMRAYHAGDEQRADLRWHDVQAIWSRAWAANCASLEFMQGAGLERFAPVKPQRWVIASFEHHCGPHGAPRPHVHNIVITALTTGFRHGAVADSTA